MLKSIIRKEILSNLLSYKFSIITILSTILIFVSIFVMYGDYRLALENYQIQQPNSESGKNFIIIPPTPLAIFARGLEENLCRSYLGDENVVSKQKSLNDLFRLFTAPDLLYIIKVILSLCAMLFSYDLVSGGKETGTLRQSLSNSLKRPILIFGKWLGGFISFILPFFVAVLLGTIFVTLSTMVDMNTNNFLRLGLFLLSSVIYLAVFLSLGLLISCLTHRSSTSLIISLFIWTILVFLIPNLGNVLAHQSVKIPTVQQLGLKRWQSGYKIRFERDKREDSKGDNSRRQEILRRIERIELEREKLTEDYRNRLNSLIKASKNISRISPTAAFTLLSTDIMGTGISEERKLKSTVIQYVSLSWNDRPVFNYRRSSIKEALGRGGLSNCLILILFNILFFTIAYVAFLRYDVR
jgi:ABC-type transport system involved in multi-copper enzyme maturation permease subunit